MWDPQGNYRKSNGTGVQNTLEIGNSRDSFVDTVPDFCCIDCALTPFHLFIIHFTCYLFFGSAVFPEVYSVVSF